MRLISLLWLAVICGSAVASAGQTTPETKPTTEAQPTYRNTEFGFTYFYPPGWEQVDAQAVAEAGHQRIYGADPKAEREHEEAKKCIRPIAAFRAPASAKNFRPLITLYAANSGCVPNVRGAILWVAEHSFPPGVEIERVHAQLPVPLLPSPQSPAIMPEVSTPPLLQELYSAKNHDFVRLRAHGKVRVKGIPPIRAAISNTVHYERGYFLIWSFVAEKDEELAPMFRTSLVFDDLPEGHVFLVMYPPKDVQK
jgi:hypothetical protein